MEDISKDPIALHRDWKQKNRELSTYKVKGRIINDCAMDMTFMENDEDRTDAWLSGTQELSTQLSQLRVSSCASIALKGWIHEQQP